MQRRGWLAILVGLFVGAQTAQAAEGSVGILMPTVTSQRWVMDGLSLVRNLYKLRISSVLKYANDDPEQQISQIDDLVEKGAKVLVIAAVDGGKLGPALERAAQKKIKVIAYDRLIRDTPNVDYYATFDNVQVGTMQAQYIVKRLDLDRAKGPFNIELFAGSPDDNNAHVFFNASMAVLKPYLDKGVLQIPSGQRTMDAVSTMRWSGSTAANRLKKILEKNYAKQKLDAILSPNDGIAVELIAGMKRSGYGPGELKLPIITGQDADLSSVRAIIRKEQTSTVFKDNRNLADATSRMVADVLAGKKPEINDDKSYNNGQKVVPSLLLKPELVDEQNWHDVLVKSGFYKSHQFN